MGAAPVELPAVSAIAEMRVIEGRRALQPRVSGRARDGPLRPRRSAARSARHTLDRRDVSVERGESRPRARIACRETRHGFDARSTLAAGQETRMHVFRCCERLRINSHGSGERVCGGGSPDFVLCSFRALGEGSEGTWTPTERLALTRFRSTRDPTLPVRVRLRLLLPPLCALCASSRRTLSASLVPS